jgi:glycosyltransferase involved in cell wall biosynthesis
VEKPIPDRATGALPLVSIVIATLNRDEPLCNTLRYFFDVETYPRFEVIVIDQSATHDTNTLEFLAAAAARMTYVKTSYRSLPRARNEGAKLARGEIVVYMDDDVEPATGVLFGHAGHTRTRQSLELPDQPQRRASLSRAAWS